MIASSTYTDRQQRLRTAMEDVGFDLVAVYADVRCPGNVFYLTNWREPAGGINQAWCLFLMALNGIEVVRE